MCPLLRLDSSGINDRVSYNLGKKEIVDSMSALFYCSKLAKVTGVHILHDCLLVCASPLHTVACGKRLETDIDLNNELVSRSLFILAFPFFHFFALSLFYYSNLSLSCSLNLSFLFLLFDDITIHVTLFHSLVSE